MGVTRTELLGFYTDLLTPQQFKDYGPNGLQIEGAEKITKIAFAVSATRDSINKAVNEQAQALVVHHGLFWKFHGPRSLVGPYAQRVFPLVRNEINLFGYHLPLDAHPEVGNAAVLAKLLGCLEQQPFGNYHGSSTGIKALLETPLNALTLKSKLEQTLKHPVILASHDQQLSINSIGIITGGANSDWQLAVEQGLDAYITGEISEHDWHESQEAGIHMFAGGHHATEQFGIQALMQRTVSQFDLECIYIDSDNPA